VITAVACTAAPFVLPAEQAATVISIIKWLALAVIGGTAVEDAAQKLTNGAAK
jgi:hypothetical protein